MASGGSSSSDAAPAAAVIGELEPHKALLLGGGEDGSGSTVSLNKDEWAKVVGSLRFSRAEMNRLVMDYLVMRGYKEAAESFAREAEVPVPPTVMLDERIRIQAALEAGHVAEAVLLVNDLMPWLFDTQRYLYFHVLQQHVIELIRQNNVEEALDFAQKNLADKTTDSVEALDELERTMALLAFDSPEASPFSDLMDLSRRKKVANELFTAILDHHAVPSQPRLAVLMKTMLWAQAELDRKKIKYPRMSSLAAGAFEDPKIS